MINDFRGNLASPCTAQKDFCLGCDSHFMNVRPHIKSVVVTKHFSKDLGTKEEVESIVRSILDCSSIAFHELHKFEEHLDGNMIFRAKEEHMHIVYCVDRKMRIIFLRAFRNFKEYKRFLGDKKEIQNMILHS